jgi:hypothetical protein
MSVNPSAVSAVGNANASNAAAVEALIAADVTALAADAQALQAQVTVGQVVTAQVLPSNGLTDLVSILGNRVAASLPPNFVPGDQFTAQVTGFNGPQILLQALGTVEPPVISDVPPPGLSGAGVQPPTQTGPGAAAPAQTTSALEAAASRPVVPAGITPSVAPPPAVFVAASVRPAPLPAEGVVLTQPPSAQPAQLQIAVPADIEARLAAARAGQVGVSAPLPSTIPVYGSSATPAPSAPPPLFTGGPGAAPPAPTPAASAPAPAGAGPAPPSAPAGTAAAPQPISLPGRFVLMPTISPSTRFAEPAPAGTTQLAAATPAGVSAYRDPPALVRALGLPVTPTNLAAAKLAIDTPQRLPAALATLESALPQGDDARVATLRTLVAFLGKIEPSSPQLPAQISAYVDNVVTGNEPKLAQLLTAQLTADQQATVPASGDGAETQTSAAAPVPTVPAVALAQVAERGAALQVDLKTQLFALINAPAGADAAEDVLPSASSALTAITAIQLNAAQAMNVSPQTMSFTIPMWLGSGYAQARVAIDRDAPDTNGKRSLDGDNFHIAFVLDTKHLGTVSVDLQTVGRAFSLAVKTENETTAKRFGEALGRLTDRLESLRYRVNSAEATVALRGAAANALMPPPDPVAVADEEDGVSSDVNVRA